MHLFARFHKGFDDFKCDEMEVFRFIIDRLAIDDTRDEIAGIGKFGGVFLDEDGFRKDEFAADGHSFREFRKIENTNQMGDVLTDTSVSTSI